MASSHVAFGKSKNPLKPRRRSVGSVRVAVAKPRARLRLRLRPRNGRIVVSPVGMSTI